MNAENWTSVDQYLSGELLEPDPILERVLIKSSEAGLPAIQVSALQGKLLQLLARMIGAKRVLEVGTLGGYSAIWLARGLPEDGQLVTLELEDRHADLAESNVRDAGLESKITVLRGPAMSSLQQLAKQSCADFDFVFIDADKQSCADYFAWAQAHTRVGGAIVVDNVVRGGAVTDEKSSDESVRGVRRFLRIAREQRRVDFSALQTVGAKGYDGLAVGLVGDSQV